MINISTHPYKNIYVYLLLIFPLLMLIASCEDQSTAPGLEGEPPDLPSSEVFNPSMAMFDNSPGITIDSSSSVPEDYQNFSFAAGKTSIYSTVITGNTIVPATLLAAATGTTPNNTDEGWQWNYEVTHNQSSFNATLFANVNPSEQKVNWELQASANWSGISFNELTFLKGTSQLNGQDGHWYTFRPVGTSETDTTSRTQYSFQDSLNFDIGMRILTTQELKNDSLYFSRDDSLKTVKHFSSSEQDSVVINWNITTGSGSIKDPSYNNGDLACWDSTFANTECPVN